MAEKSWLRKVRALKKLIAQIGALFPAPSTKLAGYAEDGPYHCEDCSFLKGQKAGSIFKDENGKGRCFHPVMIMDPEIKKDKDGFPIVNIEKGCCAFVDQKKD